MLVSNTGESWNMYFKLCQTSAYMKCLSIVFQIPGLSQLHDRHLSLKPSGVLDQHGVQEEPDGRRVRRHEVKPPAFQPRPGLEQKIKRSYVGNAAVRQRGAGKSRHIALLISRQLPCFYGNQIILYCSLLLIFCLLSHACGVWGLTCGYLGSAVQWLGGVYSEVPAVWLGVVGLCLASPELGGTAGPCKRAQCWFAEEQLHRAEGRSLMFVQPSQSVQGLQTVPCTQPSLCICP